MSFRDCLDCFILRGRSGSEVLQRIQVRDTRYQKDMLYIPNTVAGTWRVLRREFSATEKPIVQRFPYSLRFTPFVLENMEHPGIFHRIIDLFNVPLPRRGGLEIPRGCVLGDVGPLRDLERFIQYGTTTWLTLDSRTERAREASYNIAYQFTHSFERSVFENLSTLSGISVNSASSFPSSSSSLAAEPTVRHSSPIPSVQALKPFVARILAEAVRNKGEDCPITLDSMASCEKLYVPTCGHVCSDEGCRSLASCPVCREQTAWTTVEFTN